MGTSEIVYGLRKGHITGSVSVPMPDLVDWDTGVFASAEAMKAHFDQADVLSADRVITYCGGGGFATTDATGSFNFLAPENTAVRVVTPGYPIVEVTTGAGGLTLDRFDQFDEHSAGGPGVQEGHATSLGARSRRITEHRRWALRLFMAASAVWFFRVGLMGWTMLTGRKEKY